MSKLPSWVLFCQDKPGDINSKYSGESERNIGSIFKYCKEISKQLSKTVFLFFYEGDTFFGKVSAGGEGYGSVAASNIRCELTARHYAPISEDNSSVFVFTASNKFIDFDDCFKDVLVCSIYFPFLMMIRFFLVLNSNYFYFLFKF